ncbi:uncharacterized protein [Dysidea avara]|uniref:uncharacterized protein isoform X2 n=1 Tax=Dysidea avara TaxID=196820 RepID=UPI00331E6987
MAYSERDLDLETQLRSLELPVVTRTNKKEPKGTGSYANVYEVMVHETVCAAKAIHPLLMSETKKRAFLAECVQCSRILHPNVVQFLGIHYPSPDAQFPWLVMEMMYISLTGLIEKYEKEDFPFHVKLSILVDTCQGIQYLHSRNIIHRDLSSNNILLTKYLVAKVGDLGVAKVVSRDLDKHTQAPGTITFMPPETLSTNPVYGPSIDVFSLGCVCVHMVSLQWPTPSDRVTADDVVLSEIQRREVYLINLTKFPVLTQLVEKCLQNKSEKRPAIGEVLKDLKNVEYDQHPCKHDSIIELFKGVKDLENVLNQKDQQLTAKENQLVVKDQQLSQKNEQLYQKDQQLRQKDEELAQINKSTQIRVKDTHKGEKAHKKEFITKHTPVISSGAVERSQEKKSESLEICFNLLSITVIGILVAILFGMYLQSETKNSTCEQIAPVTFEMRNFTTKMNNITMWWSDPFFAFCRGYKMCLMVNYGYYGMSVYLYLMKGPYDDELERSGYWPVRGTFKIEILDQVSDDNYIKYISFDGVSSNHTNRVKEPGRAPNGYGNCFIPHKTILDSNYLKHNSFYFMISYHPNGTLKQTANTPYEYVAPVTFKTYDFTQKTKNQFEWNSGLFFSFWRGHKMFLTVYAWDFCDDNHIDGDDDDIDGDDDDDVDNIVDGDDEDEDGVNYGDDDDDYGDETDDSDCYGLHYDLYHMKGPYDDELKQSGHWPLIGAFKIELKDQLNGNNHTHYVSFDGKKIVNRRRRRRYIQNIDFAIVAKSSCQVLSHKGGITNYDNLYLVISYQSNSNMTC